MSYIFEEGPGGRPIPVAWRSTDKPPPGFHYDPYTRALARNLTEAEVQNLWPYAKKETPKVEPIDHWLEDALKEVAPVPSPTELYSAPPRRLLTDKDLAANRVPVRTTSVDVDFEDPKLQPKADALTLEAVGSVVNNLLTSADMVVMPEHYARFKIEPIRFICENNLNFFQGNIIKYVLRHDAKNGLEDLKKARRYLDMFIKFVEGDPDWWRKEGGT